jgi:hypothetical protein
VKPWLVIGVVVGALGVARLARYGAVNELAELEIVDEPFTPSQSATPFISLGYRELLADLLFARLRGYYGGYYTTTADGLATLGEAVVTADPYFEPAYDFAAGAMTIAPFGVDQAAYKRSIALLERGIPIFPQNWKMPLLAGQMYIQDLTTEDPAERRKWDERGVLLVESAIRKPNAPVQTNADWAAVIRTRLGQRDRAVSGLRELLLTTKDRKVQQKLTARLALLEKQDASEIASELYEGRKRFDNTWKSIRPELSVTMYILLGPHLGTSFDMTDLATGGRDFIGGDEIERLEPLYEEPAPTP